MAWFLAILSSLTDLLLYRCFQVSLGFRWGMTEPRSTGQDLERSAGESRELMRKPRKKKGKVGK